MSRLHNHHHITGEPVVVEMSKLVAVRKSDLIEINHHKWDRYPNGIGMTPWYGSKYFTCNYGRIQRRAWERFATNSQTQNENPEDWDMVVAHSTTPAKKLGCWQWTTLASGKKIKAKCSACSCVIKAKVGTSVEVLDMDGVKYCPNCGAEMSKK